MPDIDSKEAASRQNPGSLARSRPAAPKPRLTGHPTTRKRTVSAPKPRRKTVKVKKSSSSGRRKSSNTNYSNNQKQNYNRAVTRRATNNKKRVVAPKPPPAAKKIITPPAPPKPVAPDLKKFLAGDSVYQQQLAAFNKSLADYQADQGLATTDYTTNYGNTRRDIDLAKSEAAGDLEEDYASRGLIRSGLYNTALGDLNQQYQNQYTDLDEQKMGFMSNLAQELKKYQNEQSVQKTNAYNDAVRRRAEKYNL